MPKHTIHHNDAMPVCSMPLEDAVKFLDGRKVVFDNYGFEVKYNLNAKRHNAIWANVRDIYTECEPKNYCLNLVVGSTGQYIIDQTLFAFESYIKKSGANNAPAPRQIKPSY